MASPLAAILLAGGAGRRLGAGCPKALVPLAGRPLVRWSAEALAGTPGLSRLIVVYPAGSPERVWRDALAGLAVPCEWAEGGPRRRDSVAAGLRLAGDGTVLVHDAARPLVTVPLVERVARAAERAGAAVPAVPVPDALVRERDGRVEAEIERGRLRAVQTPQGFDAPLLRRCHDAAPGDWDAPDDGAVVRRCGHEVALVPGDPENLKITWPADLARAEAILAARGGGPGSERAGIGWDVHPIAEGRPFRLAGVTVDPSRGPAGHSDGDPLAHAVADALLGAAALGDVGELFPDDDPACAGMAGDELLRRTVRHLAGAGWRPVQVDAVLVLDRPKRAPARDRIRQALAAALGLAPEAVSVKAKRTEGLGALAGGAGVACHALARIAPARPAPPAADAAGGEEGRAPRAGDPA
ncbi:MAG: 2-C-methyl-D-erythritol 4-phosphate cytidylyltransferase [Acidobacteria bacterium]|nr:MAG: 2-C-methyl-D-erythritol 4-phosphate cytidylyltransferase [Acidobacteriota bacterium]